jgi:hypothetical protein
MVAAELDGVRIGIAGHERARGVAAPVERIDRGVEIGLVAGTGEERRLGARGAFRSVHAHCVGIELRSGAEISRDVGERPVPFGHVGARLAERVARTARAPIEIAERAGGAAIDRVAREGVIGAEVAARGSVAAGQIARRLVPGEIGAPGDVVLRLSEQRARTFGGLLRGIAGEDVEDSDGTYSL